MSQRCYNVIAQNVRGESLLALQTWKLSVVFRFFFSSCHWCCKVCKFWGNCVNWYCGASLSICLCGKFCQCKVRKLSCRRGNNNQGSTAPLWHYYRHQTGAAAWHSEGLLPQKIPHLHRLVSQRTGKSGQIIYVTEILPSLWFGNLSSTYQKGNLHCDPINPLSALLFAFYSSLSSHIVEFLMARFCCCAHDRLGRFSSV